MVVVGVGWRLGRNACRGGLLEETVCCFMCVEQLNRRVCVNE